DREAAPVARGALGTRSRDRPAARRRVHRARAPHRLSHAPAVDAERARERAQDLRGGWLHARRRGAEPRARPGDGRADLAAALILIAMVIRKPPVPHDVPPGACAVFLAGSIEMGTASAWQDALTAALADRDLVILNPRRDAWDASWSQSIDNPMFREQVEWEL